MVINKSFNIPIEEYLREWKKQNRLPSDEDDYLDTRYIGYLNASARNIYTQYMKRTEKLWDTNPDAWKELTEDERFKSAVFHLTTSFYENPDTLIVLTSGTMVNQGQIFNLLGELVSYF